MKPLMRIHMPAVMTALLLAANLNAQQPAAARVDDEYGLRLPARDHLFRLESEEAFRARLRQELPNVKNVQFPKDVPFASEPAKVEVFPRQVVGPTVQPICYRPLYFEQKRPERFGQYVPYVQPLLSASRFYLDALLLPGRILIAPPWTFECDNR